jgi:DnaJ like chaperone protein
MHNPHFHAWKSTELPDWSFASASYTLARSPRSGNPMSIWTRITEIISALANGESLAEVFEKLKSPPERSAAFAIAVISLAAKMAKADGQVTRNEVRAFREVFYIAPEDEKAAARVFNLAREDVAGYAYYARKIGRMFDDDDQILEHLMEGLFHIAIADGDYNEVEDEFLQTVAAEFGLTSACFRCLRARSVPDADPDPYTVLGVTPDTPIEEIHARWRVLVRENHPDALMSHGLPEEAIKLATHRLTAINEAWEEIQRAA